MQRLVIRMMGCRDAGLSLLLDSYYSILYAVAS